MSSFKGKKKIVTKSREGKINHFYYRGIHRTIPCNDLSLPGKRSAAASSQCLSEPKNCNRATPLIFAPMKFSDCWSMECFGLETNFWRDLMAPMG